MSGHFTKRLSRSDQEVPLESTRYVNTINIWRHAQGTILKTVCIRIVHQRPTWQPSTTAFTHLAILTVLGTGYGATTGHIRWPSLAWPRSPLSVAACPCVCTGILPTAPSRRVAWYNWYWLFVDPWPLKGLCIQWVSVVTCWLQTYGSITTENLSVRYVTKDTRAWPPRESIVDC